MNGEEKRTSPRVPTPLDVDCSTADPSRVPVTARISDLSRTGAFLDCLNPLPVGTPLALRFAIHDHLVSVAAEVVHAMPQFGMGVRFLRVSPASQTVIESLLQSGD